MSETRLSLDRTSVGNLSHDMGALTTVFPVDPEPPSPDSMMPWNLPLVKEMPWRTDFVRRFKEWPSLVPLELQAMSHALLAKFRESYANPVYKKIVCNQATLSPNQKSADPLPGLLFSLKFLDTAVDVGRPVSLCRNNEGYETPSNGDGVVPRSTFQGQTCRLRGVRTLSDKSGWPRILSNMQAALGTCGPVRDGTLSPDDLRTSSSQQLVVTAIRLLGALSSRDTNMLVLKVLQNLEMTAFFINYLLQGNYDFPPSCSALVKDLQSAAERECVTTSLPDDFPPITRLRQGLFLALAVSPLLLIKLTLNLHYNSAWYHYGSTRPPILRRVEAMLWRRLFAIARGSLSAIDALKQFIRDTAELVPLATDEQYFFSPSAGLCATMPVAISYEPATISRRFVALSVAQSLNSSSEGCSSSTFDIERGEASERQRQAGDRPLDISSILVSALWDLDTSDESTALSEENSSQGTLCESASDTGSSGCGRKEVGRCIKRFRGSKDATWSSEESTEGLMKDNPKFMADEGFDSRKGRKQSSFAASKLGFARLIHWPRLSQCTWRKRVRGTPYFLVSPDGRPRTYWPSLYLTSDLDVLARFFVKANRYQLENGNEELFFALVGGSAGNVAERVVASSAGSPVLHVRSCSQGHFQSLIDTARLSSLLHQSFLVVKGPGQAAHSMRDYEISLAKIGASWRDWQAVGECSKSSGRILALMIVLNDKDGSLRYRNSTLEDLFVQASFHDFLFHANMAGDGKSISFPCVFDEMDLPGTHVSGTPCTYSLELLAHPTASCAGAADIQNLSWHFVATADVWQSHDTAPDGFNVEFSVELGATLIFIGMDASDLSFPACTATFNVDGRVSPDSIPDVAGILLHAGDRM
ncbi:hypothetical protein VNI00_013134 [Paramarasmius palmivorus]|uniref:TLDc domain-containing protein n=1 Tax=Paramarasmius palmivorus TaxID=297713 RepID=A0AAW0BZN5_9AGAR